VSSHGGKAKRGQTPFNPLIRSLTLSMKVELSWAKYLLTALPLNTVAYMLNLNMDLVFFFFSPLLLCWVRVHCGIYRGSYKGDLPASTSGGDYRCAPLAL
jgi:hypothetical protein